MSERNTTEPIMIHQRFFEIERDYFVDNNNSEIVWSKGSKKLWQKMIATLAVTSSGIIGSGLGMAVGVGIGSTLANVFTEKSLNPPLSPE